MQPLRSLLRRRPVAAILALPIGFTLFKAAAATFQWRDPSLGGGSTGNWSQAINPLTSLSNWLDGGGNASASAPSGTDVTDQLTFGGPVATDTGGANPPPAYVSTNDRSSFLLNRIRLTATDTNGAAADVPQSIAGNLLTLTGIAPSIVQDGTGPVAINAPLRFATDLALAGDGAGVVTLNNILTGAADLTKTGTSTFRFGSQVVGAVEQPSNNTWFGRLAINGGTIRFNNNAASGRTALRSNPITLSDGTSLSATSELRTGTLNGVGGTVENVAAGSNTNTASIVIHTLDTGTYGGTLRIGAPTGTGTTQGSLVVRGPGMQILTQSGINAQMTLNGGDMQVGAGSTLVFAGNANVAAEAKGAVILNGGTFQLNNSVVNIGNRLRGGNNDVDVTGLESVGGGTFSLIGNVAGSSESIARLQLGSVNNSGTVSTARSGALTINVTHAAAAAAGTTLYFTAYTRNAITAPQDTTVNFTANDAAGNALPLGQALNNPRIFLEGLGGASGFTVPIAKIGQTSVGTLDNTSAGPTGSGSDTGWATINGTDFAGYSSTNGVTPLTGLTTVGAIPGTGSATTNYLLAASRNANAFQANTLKIAPTAAGQALNVGTSFTAKGLVLGGSMDYSLTGAGSFAESSFPGNKNRYFHVQEATLTVGIPIAGSGTIVKAGAGTLALTAASNSSTAGTTINAGLVRATTANLPGGQLEFRGGVLEVSGGGTISRAVGVNAGEVNWSGFDAVNGSVSQDRGSGGFAALGGDLTIDLGGAAVNSYAWEDDKFLNSGHALVFGSRSADSRVTWTDNLSLSALTGTVNYNLREIRVNDNAASATDVARISGVISGTVQNDLLKTGAGVLELTNTNAYAGATIIHQGALLVNGVNATSFLHDVRPAAVLGGRGTTGAVRLENGASVANASILAPGDVLGNASILSTGDLTFAGTNTKLSIEIGGNAAGGDSTTGYDRINVTGGLSLNGAQLEGSLLNGFAASTSDLLFIILNDGVDAVLGTFAQGAAVTIGAQTFDISYTANFAGSSFTGGNDVALRAVPEPSAALLSLAGAALFLRRRRA